MAADVKNLDFAAELAIGKPNSLGNTLKVVKVVESNSKLFPQLLKLLLHAESRVIDLRHNGPSAYAFDLSKKFDFLRVKSE